MKREKEKKRNGNQGVGSNPKFILLRLSLGLLRMESESMKTDATAEIKLFSGIMYYSDSCRVHSSPFYLVFLFTSPLFGNRNFSSLILEQSFSTLTITFFVEFTKLSRSQLTPFHYYITLILNVKSLAQIILLEFRLNSHCLELTLWNCLTCTPLPIISLRYQLRICYLTNNFIFSICFPHLTQRIKNVQQYIIPSEKQYNSRNLKCIYCFFIRQTNEFEWKFMQFSSCHSLQHFYVPSFDYLKVKAEKPFLEKKNVPFQLSACFLLKTYATFFFLNYC